MLFQLVQIQDYFPNFLLLAPLPARHFTSTPCFPGTLSLHTAFLSIVVIPPSSPLFTLPTIPLLNLLLTFLSVWPRTLTFSLSKDFRFHVLLCYFPLLSEITWLSSPLRDFTYPFLRSSPALPLNSSGSCLCGIIWQGALFSS